MLALHLHDPDSDCLRAGMRDRCGKSQERKNIPGGEHMQGIEIPGKQVNQLKWNRGFKLGRKVENIKSGQIVPGLQYRL